ncbi:Uncharacterised protein [Vibrio cholerae]|nr:Uncharacterised protein [Vibrio cholerae]
MAFHLACRVFATLFTKFGRGDFLPRLAHFLLYHQFDR